MPLLRKTPTPHLSARSTLSVSAFPRTLQRLFSAVRPRREEADSGQRPSDVEPSVEEKLAALHKEMATLRWATWQREAQT